MEFDLRLITVGFSILLSIIISVIVLLNDKTSDTNKTFFAFTIATILWGIINFLSFQLNFENKQVALLFLRLNIFFGLWQSFYLLRFFLTFPNKKYKNEWWMSFILWPLVVITSALIFSPYVFSEVTKFSNGRIIEVENGPGIILFGLLATGFVVSGITILFRKYIKFKEVQKKQARLILWGTFLMFLLIIIFNLILPNVFTDSSFVSISAVFIIPFLVLTSYSIIKYHLFSIKMIATELITFTLWIFILIRTLMANTLQDRVVNGVLFLIVIVVGLLLIKSVRKEVKQRERLEQLKIKLEAANEKLQGLDKLKTEFLSLASHQLRSPLTAIKGYISMILEGDYGEIDKETREVIERIFQSSQNLTKVVEDLLNVSKIEQGGMKFEMEPFNLADVALDTEKDLSINAEKSGLKISFNSDKKELCMVNGDKEKIRQVVLNLIDNSIKYTKKGSINVSVKRVEDKVVFAVKDTGMGMTKEIKDSLFQKFARGNGSRMNTSGSGLGLYLGREIMKAHKGKIYIESPGPDKGSTFSFELDAVLT